MWARLCICACVVSSLLRAAVAQGEEVQENFEAAHLDHKIWPRRPRALMSIDEERRLAQVDYAGDYAPAHNKNAASSPPVVKRRRSLLQEYGSWANQRSPSSPSKCRKLLQDYSPVANQRTPSSPKRHKP